MQLIKNGAKKRIQALKKINFNFNECCNQRNKLKTNSSTKKCLQLKLILIKLIGTKKTVRESYFGLYKKVLSSFAAKFVLFVGCNHQANF